MVESSNNIVFNYISIITNRINIWYQNINKYKIGKRKRKKVSFEDNVKIRIIPNDDGYITEKVKSIFYEPYTVTQNIESSKIIVSDTNDDFDLFVYFEE